MARFFFFFFFHFVCLFFSSGHLYNKLEFLKHASQVKNYLDGDGWSKDIFFQTQLIFLTTYKLILLRSIDDIREKQWE